MNRLRQSDLLKHWIDYEKLFRTIAGVRGAGVSFITITVDIHQSKPHICSGISKTPAPEFFSTPAFDQTVTEMPRKGSLQTRQIGHARIPIFFSCPPARHRVKVTIIVSRIPKDLPCIRSILEINKPLGLGLTVRRQRLPRNRSNK